MQKSQTKSGKAGVSNKNIHDNENIPTIDEIVARKVLAIVKKAVSGIGDNVIIKHLWYDRYRINIRDNAGKVVCSYFVRANLDGIKSGLDNL